MTPSLAATTRITMSVMEAPRARIAVNAAWPGVSRNVAVACTGHQSSSPPDTNQGFLVKLISSS